MFSFPQTWTVWKNGPGSCSNIRRHLKAKHFKLWSDIVISQKLKGWQEVQRDVTSRDKERPRETFSLDGFYERLIKWVTVDDQVSLALHAM